MKEIISKLIFESRSHDYTNEIVEVLNNYLMCDFKKHVRQGYCIGSYMMFKNKDTAAIRYPGATRGHVRFDENYIITEIKLYDEYDNKCYKVAVMKELQKFIGCKLIIPQEDTNEETRENRILSTDSKECIDEIDMS
jgi:hypothetical protein